MDMADSERERVARLRTRRQTLAVEDSLEIFRALSTALSGCLFLGLERIARG